MALAAVVGPGMTSQAALTAERPLGLVHVSGASVLMPTGPLALASVNRPASSSFPIDVQPVHGSWLAPVAGSAAPDAYEVYRRAAESASDEWTSLQRVDTPSGGLLAPTSFRDTTAVHCAAYDYRVISAFKALRSSGAIEGSIVNDMAAPALEASYVEAQPNGVTALGGYIRPGHAVYVYANVSDDCGSVDLSKLTADVSALGGGAAMPLVAGAWTPNGSATTFGFRAGPFTAASGLADGATAVGTWHVNVDDGRGNATQRPGASAIVDGTGPSIASARAINADAWYPNGQRPTLGSGSQFRVFANIAEAGSGLAVSGPSVDSSMVGTHGQGDVQLQAGAWSAGPEGPWAYRSNPRTVRDLTHGSTPTFSITATDRLGNVTTKEFPAYVDNVGPRLRSCTMSSSDIYWNAGDSTTLVFDEAIAPAFVNGAAITATVMKDGTIRYGGNLVDTHAVGVLPWVTGNAPVNVDATTTATSDHATWALSYLGGGEAVALPIERSSTMRMSDKLTDSAGNSLQQTDARCAIVAPPTPPVVVEPPSTGPPHGGGPKPGNGPGSGGSNSGSGHSIEPVEPAAVVIEPIATEPPLDDSSEDASESGAVTTPS
ncbi:MAG: hypothetical protein JWM90_2812 [Thermoleophilia bacterium]|nr:hypothetical protein [Thermoleophilia bacterium]